MITPPQLFDYQVVARDKILDWVEEGDASVVHNLISVMRSGKTFIICSAISELINKGKRVWVIVDQIELLGQWRDELLIVNPTFDTKNLWYIAAGKAAIHKRPLQFVQVQTLKNRLAKIREEDKPDVIFLDEAHKVAYYRIIDKLKLRWPDTKQINVTGTPCVEGSRDQQYLDKFPLWENPNPKNKLEGTGKQYWYQAATAKEMIQLKRWRKPEWIVADEEVSARTAQRFAGMKIRGNDYDDTSQAAVMIDLLPDHIKAWQENGGEVHSTVWYCCNKAHVEATVKALNAIGRRAVAVMGDTEKGFRKTVIPGSDSGLYTDIVNYQCVTTGVTLRKVSCAVWLRRTMSVGLFCQMAGRPLTYSDENPIGLLMDLAGNLGLHPFPELIDWWAFNPSKKLFNDQYKVVCKSCTYRHDSLPKPKHPTDKKISFNVGACGYIYKDGYVGDRVQPKPSDVIHCHNCNELVYYSLPDLSAYGEWLKNTRSAIMSDKKPTKFKGDSVGISIGLRDERFNLPLTIETLYDLNIWSILEDGKEARARILDKSGEWQKTRDKQLVNLRGRDLINYKLSCLSKLQLEIYNKTSTSSLIVIEDINERYRAALGYAYIMNLPPVKSFGYWDGFGNPPKKQVKIALENIRAAHQDNHGLLKTWIEHHLEKHTDQRHKGVCRMFLKILAGEDLKVEIQDLKIQDNFETKVTLEVEELVA
jgi:superfamily II DNA or RNA helicase